MLSILTAIPSRSRGRSRIWTRLQPFSQHRNCLGQGVQSRQTRYSTLKSHRRTTEYPTYAAFLLWYHSMGNHSTTSHSALGISWLLPDSLRVSEVWKYRTGYYPRGIHAESRGTYESLPLHPLPTILQSSLFHCYPIYCKALNAISRL